jgi:hypothetical protein
MKVTKGALKRGERGNPTGPRPEIVVESVNPADLSTEEVPFDAGGSQQPVGTTATITMADFDDDDDDDDVSPQFNPPQIWTHSETMVAMRSTEVTGIMGLEASVPSLFSGQTGASTVVGTIMGNNLNRLGPRIDEQTVSNDPLANGDPFSRNQDRKNSGLGVSQVEYHHYRPEIAATTSSYLSAGVGILGSGIDRFKSTAQTGTGIFKNTFGDQWTTDMNDPIPEDIPPCTDIINQFVKIWGFSHNSLMVKYIDQQQWSELAHIVMHGLEESKDFEVFQDDGFTTLGKLMLIHQKLFKSFLLYYKWQTLWEEEGPSEAEVKCLVVFSRFRFRLTGMTQNSGQNSGQQI